MKEIGRLNGSFTNRIFYRDDEGNLVERICHDWDKADHVAEANQQAAADYNPHDKSELRRVGSIPVDVLLKLASMAGVKGWVGDPEFDEFAWSILRGGGDFKFLRTVPDSYRIGK